MTEECEVHPNLVSATRMYAAPQEGGDITEGLGDFPVGVGKLAVFSDCHLHANGRVATYGQGDAP